MPGHLHLLGTIALRNLGIGARLVAGVVSLGIYSLIELLAIGLSLGHLVRTAAVSGHPLHELALITLPHSVLELTAFALLGALEFEAGVLAYRKLRYDRLELAPSYAAAVGKRAMAGFGLIALAAVVETYLTGALAAGL